MFLVAGANFALTYRLADNDLEASGGIDTLNLVSPTLTSNLNVATGLVIGTGLTVTGTQSITISATVADCKKVLFLCAHVDKGTGAHASYTADTTLNNNWECLDIRRRISCDIGE